VNSLLDMSLDDLSDEELEELKSMIQAHRLRKSSGEEV